VEISVLTEKFLDFIHGILAFARMTEERGWQKMV